MPKNQLSKSDQASFLKILHQRFDQNKHRHQTIVWSSIEKKLIDNPNKLWSLYEMEKTGGEPDVVSYDKKTDSYNFFDCVAESPAGRRSLCYDNEAWESRKENKPNGSAIGMADRMGVNILTEEQYRFLQTFGKVDTKTSSWIQTPDKIRKLGGAIFCDYRYATIFVYHNGAESYYASRGFRACLSL